MFADAALASRLETLIEHECNDCVPVKDDRDRPLWRARLPEALARLVSPLL